MAEESESIKKLEELYEKLRRFKVTDPMKLINDPLQDVTRRERRFLLGVSALGIAMVKAHLIPQKISALGIDFQEIKETVLLQSIAMIVLYFAIAFLLYAVSDLIAWRIGYHEAVKELKKISRQKDEYSRLEEEQDINSLEWRLIHTSVKPVAVLRALFEFVAPVMIAAYAIIILLGGRQN